MSLYQITAEYKNLFERLESEPENIEALIEEVEVNEQNFNDNALNYCKFIRSQESEVEAIEKEIDRLKDLKQSKQKVTERLKENLKNSMQVFGKEKIDLNLFKVSLRKSESVNIDDEVILPSKFTVIKTQPDKKAIKEYLKAGNELEGCQIVENQSLLIK